nr:helix-turn-helix domain-containing protein [Azotobacter chroococcum]
MTDDAPDKVSEKQMAEFLGITKRALEGRRARGQIPEGVWNRNGRSIIYSRKRYEEWLESQWVCPPGWRSEATQSAFASSGTEKGTPKRSTIPRRNRASWLHPVLEIR